jgi:hypothetical protein
MAWFNQNRTSKPTNERSIEGAVLPINPQGAQAPPVNIMVNAERIDQRRPCWVRGKKALFHGWAKTAHPVPPRNIPAEQINAETRFFQLRRTDALVEFEDGTTTRVYASEVQFADGGGFDKFDWLPMNEEGQDDGTEQP